MPDRAYTDADIDHAINAITDPERLREALDLVARTAPSLHGVLATALAEGGWFDLNDQVIREAAAAEHADERARAMRVLVKDEARLAMLVGVAVGFELARELGHANQQED